MHNTEKYDPLGGREMKRLVAILSIGALVAFGLVTTASGAPLSGHHGASRFATPAMTKPTRAGSYIVVLKSGAGAPQALANEEGAMSGFRPTYVYSHALRGYAAHLDPSQLAAVEADPSTASVSPNRTFEAVGYAPPQIVPWDSIPRLGADQSSTHSGDGSGSVDINVAVLDTGIDLKNKDLNVVGGKNCVGDRGSNHGYTDNNFHGTFVAGRLAAEDNDGGVVGIAPGANLYSVKVLNGKGKGTDAQILCGIDWVTATRTDANPSNDISVVNMSLEGPGHDDGNCGYSNHDPDHIAICASTAAGVTYAVAAGNDSTDEANGVPAAYHEVITATAMADTDGMPGGTGGAPPYASYCGLTFPDQYTDDAPAFFSNYAVSPADQAHTVAAPGVCAISIAYERYLSKQPPYYGHNYFAVDSGTSFASPVVAGTVALCIASGPCAGLTPAQIVAKIVGDAAAYNVADPGYGFSGDPLHSPTPGEYYGYLIRVSLY